MGFLERNIAAILMILFTLLLRKFLLQKVPHQVFGVLWGLVIIRLYIPYSYETDLNIYNGIYAIRTVIAEKNPLQISNQQYYLDRSFIEFIEIPGIKHTLLAVWLLGAVILAVCFYRDYQKVRILWETSVVSEDATMALNILKKNQIQSNIAIRTSDEITVPMACGILRKGILLPVGFAGFSEEEQLQMLMHEYMHLKYRHTFLQLLVISILCLNWFNPILWLWYQYINRDMEIACDTHVLDVLGQEQRKSYALNLLNMAEKQNYQDVFCTGFARHSIQERMIAIMKYKRTTALAIIISMLIPAGVAFLFGTSDNYVYGDEIDRGEITVKVQIAESTDMLYIIRYENLQPYIVEEKEDRIVVEKLRYPGAEGSLPENLMICEETEGCLYKGKLTLTDMDSRDSIHTGYYSGTLYK